MKIGKKKQTPKWFFIVLILIPIVFFVLLELSLRLFSYGKNLPQWVDANKGKYIINPDVAFRYFNQVKNIPTTIEDVFDQQKKKDAFRVFVMGGSSAAGFPYMPTGSFSRYIRKRLELTYPNTPIEVVNVSLSAVNTYTVLDLLPEVLEQKPDLILIYAGHNEYYGALGVGSMESLGTSRSFVKLVLYLNKYKTVQLIRNSITGLLSLFNTKNSEDPSGTLMSN
ncbi:MAG: SGNH/GDSL hydrolase family protein, partial [Ignavibacteria bacterium]|nr:SGNH/GDSL hydrolase family protein [Ignavibacteria bacterium]